MRRPLRPVLPSVQSVTERAVNFIVKEAAERAGVNSAASIYYLRHAHAPRAIAITESQDEVLTGAVG